MISKNIVERCGMRSDPAKYSGKRANIKDLNGIRLEKILAEIERNVGEAAGENFILLVRELPDLSATAFLKTLYNLENNGWRWSHSLISNNIQIDNNFQIIATAVRTLTYGNKPSQTDEIRESFLANYDR